MVIYSRPKPFNRIDGKPWQARVQVYDAPFSKSNGKSFTLHVNGQPSPIEGQPAQPLFEVVDQKGTSVKIKIS